MLEDVVVVDKFEELLDQSMAGDYSVGSTVKGKVVQISEEGIFVDIGTKSEAILAYNKIIPDDIPELDTGSEIEAKIIGRKEGIFHLSKRALDFERGWNKVKKDFDSQQIINVRIVRKVNNGFLAEAYRVASGFIHEKNFNKPPEIGTYVDAVISEFNQKNKKVVFTRKPIIIAEKKKKIEEEYTNLQVGIELEGRVEKLSNFGAFVRITNHIVGLLHISEMSHDHIKAPSSVCKVGDKIKVRIINIDHENGRVGLSHKETYTDPILDIVEGEDYEGVVENLTEFGAFVRLPNSVVGLVHISEVSYSRFEKLSDILRPSAKVRVKVLSVNIRDRRVSLSVKALEQDPWELIHEKYAVGERVDAKVKEINNAGMVVTIAEGFEGFIPIGEISHERIDHPSSVHELDDVVKAQIINIDPARRKIKLSIRQTLDRYAEDGGAHIRVSAEDAKPTAVAMTFGDVLAKSGIVASVKAEGEEPKLEVEAKIKEPASKDDDDSSKEKVTKKKPVSKKKKADAPADTAKVDIAEVKAEGEEPKLEAEAKIKKPASKDEDDSSKEKVTKKKPVSKKKKTDTAVEVGESEKSEEKDEEAAPAEEAVTTIPTEDVASDEKADDSDGDGPENVSDVKASESKSDSENEESDGSGENAAGE